MHKAPVKESIVSELSEATAKFGEGESTKLSLVKLVNQKGNLNV